MDVLSLSEKCEALTRPVRGRVSSGSWRYVCAGIQRERWGETWVNQGLSSGRCEQEPCYFNRTHPLTRATSTPKPSHGPVAMPISQSTGTRFFMGAQSHYTKPTMIQGGFGLRGRCCTLESTIRFPSSFWRGFEPITSTSWQYLLVIELTALTTLPSVTKCLDYQIITIARHTVTG